MPRKYTHIKQYENCRIIRKTPYKKCKVWLKTHYKKCNGSMIRHFYKGIINGGLQE